MTGSHRQAHTKISPAHDNDCPHLITVRAPMCESQSTACVCFIYSLVT